MTEPDDDNRTKHDYQGIAIMIAASRTLMILLGGGLAGCATVPAKSASWISSRLTSVHLWRLRAVDPGGA